MGCGKKTELIDTATNLATLEMAGTHWQLTVDDQGNAVWTAARSAGAEGPDTDRARDLKLSASVDVSELATDPMAYARTRTRPASWTSSPPRSGR